MDVDRRFPAPLPPPPAALLDRAERAQLLVRRVAEPDAVDGRRLGLRRLRMKERNMSHSPREGRLEQRTHDQFGLPGRHEGEARGEQDERQC